MKQGTSLINFVMIMLAVGLACYLGVYIYNSFDDPFTTTYAYEYIISDSAPADGFLVRPELVLESQAGVVEYQVSEGERIGKGQAVAIVYRDSQAALLQGEIQALKLEAEMLRAVISGGNDPSSAAQLDEHIIQALIELRADAGNQTYTKLEDQMMQLKSAVLKRDYTYNADLGPQQLNERLSEINGQLAALTVKNEGMSNVVRTPVAGTYCALVDGYETLLTPEGMLSMTPDDLTQLGKQQISPNLSSAGKIITGTQWYYVCTLQEQAAARLRVGERITVSFIGDFVQDVSMRVEQVGQTQNGKTAVTLSSSRYLAQTALLRRQTVELVYNSYSGIRVPTGALRMYNVDVKDDETGEVTGQRQVLGVYIIINGHAEFKPVETVMEGGDYYVVRPLQEGARALRPGDEVIVQAVELYPGKLMLN